MRRRSLSIVVLAALAFGAMPEPAGAADPRSEAVADRAVTFLAGAQQPDGGIGPASATETPDAVIAIAEAAQRDLTYDPAEALVAVRAVTEGGNDPLDYLDDLSEDGDLSSGKAAEIALAALSVGLDPARFDPKGDGPVDLWAVMDAAYDGNGDYGLFFQTLLVVAARVAGGKDVLPATVDRIIDAQQSNGSWNYAGDPEGVPSDFSDPDSPKEEQDDPDLTGQALVALIGAGVKADADVVTRAMTFLATRQDASGGWASPSAFREVNPTTTGTVVVGITAVGFDVADRCWRDVYASERAGQAYTSPDDYLRAQQDPATGRIGEAVDFAPTLDTSKAIEGLLRSFLPPARAERRPCPTPGYRLVAADGGVFAFGSAPYAGSTGDIVLNQPMVTTAATPTGAGYWLFARDGGTFAFGDAAFLGSTGDISLNQPIVAAAATPTGGGYWLFAADGGTFAFGDAPFLGSLGDRKLNQPIVAAAATPSGRGYWLFAADGGAFAFGDAPFVGSLGGLELNRPIVGGDASRTGKGYWLFADDGGVFALGDAPFLGSQGATRLTKPIVAGARSKGDGYYLVASDGGVFAFGAAPFHGSTGAQTLNSPVVGINR